MVLIRKPIDLISPADGKRYTSITKYEQALDRAGLQIMSERQFKDMREKIYDEERTPQKPNEHFNHVHIDLANDRIIKSKKDVSDL